MSKPIVLRTNARIYALASTLSLKATASEGIVSSTGKSRPRIWRSIALEGSATMLSSMAIKPNWLD